MKNSNILSDNKRQLACLYTKHKTQKRKIWQDGRLVLNTKSLKAILHDASPPQGSGDPSIGECEVAADQVQAILRKYDNVSNDTILSACGTILETERYLIEIEGPWSNASLSTLSTSRIPQSLKEGKNIISTSMKKLLTSKYRRPKSYIPPPPGVQTSRAEKVLGKRRRPLQPGELIAKHYGGAGFHADPSRGSFGVQRRNYYNYESQQGLHSNNLFKNNGRENDENARVTPLCQNSIHVQQKDQQRSTYQGQNTNSIQNSFQPPDTTNAFGGPKGCRSVGLAPSQPKSRNAQCYRYRNPSHPPRSNANSFVQNEFDEAKFYGIDGEEELDEQEDSLRPLSKEPHELTLPQSSNALTLMNGEGGQSEDMDKTVDCNQCNDRTNKEIGKGLDSFTSQIKNGINDEEEAQRQNEYSRFQTPDSAIVSIKQRKENEKKVSNSIESVSRINLDVQEKSNEFEACFAGRGRHKVRNSDYGNTNPESEDDVSVDSNDCGPSSFRLKPVESFTIANKSKKDTTSNLLQLFGAGASKQGFHKSRNAEMTEVNVPEDDCGTRNNYDGTKSTLGDVFEGVDGNLSSGNVDRKSSKSDSMIGDGNEKNIDKAENGKHEHTSCATKRFYLASAATSSEESSDENSDED